jgi:putative phosphoribosyl transferase
MAVPYADRRDAGRDLARNLAGHPPDWFARAVVLALPRGGVPVAFEVAQAFDLLLDVFLVRKLGVPAHEELAMGALASGGVRVLNEDVVRGMGVTESEIDRVAEREAEELRRRERLYRGDRPPLDLAGRNAILVDDGLATGASMRAAVQALRLQGPASIVVAVPVAAREACDEFRDEVDEIVCSATPQPFHAVGLWYHDFNATTDEEVRELLVRAEEMHANAGRRQR